jgi:RNA polymerase sigma-70 factor (ECF subfamily)
MNLAIDWIRPKPGEEPIAFLDDVFRYAFARTGNREEAEDIAIEVVQALPSPCRKQNLRVYMLGMARRKIADHARRRRATVDLKDLDATTRFDPASDDAALVGQTLARLSDDHREVLTLKYIVGLSSREIAELVAKQPPAIDSLLQRARDAFASEWNRLTSDEVPL